MAYFLFHKQEVSEGCLYRITENEFDLNNLNIIKSDYKIIEVAQEDFLNLKLGNKHAKTYNNDDDVIYENLSVSYFNNSALKVYVDVFIKSIDQFLILNPNNPLFNKWNNYKNQLNNLNLENITYPLNKSLEQHFNDLGQPSLNPLQLP
jgi:hypothetical protein